MGWSLHFLLTSTSPTSVFPGLLLDAGLSANSVRQVYRLCVCGSCQSTVWQ